MVRLNPKVGGNSKKTAFGKLMLRIRQFIETSDISVNNDSFQIYPPI